MPKCAQHETYLCVNPGSVSIPKEDSPHGYMVLENDTLVWKTLAGEVYRTHTL